VTPITPQVRKVVRLPQTSTRAQRLYAHVKIVDRVHPLDSPIAFDGRIYPPGACVPIEDLPAQTVAIECVGQVGPRGRRKDLLWLLWKYDWGLDGWRELGRAQSVDAGWTIALRPLAAQALQHNPIDMTAHWQEIVRVLMSEIDLKLENERQETAMNVLHAVYSELAGRIARKMAA